MFLFSLFFSFVIEGGCLSTAFMSLLVLFYAPVFDLSTFKQSLITENVIATPKKTKLYIPNVVRAEFVLSQNKVLKPVKNSLAKSLINPNPLRIASIIAAPMWYLLLSYILYI